MRSRGWRRGASRATGGRILTASRTLSLIVAALLASATGARADGKRAVPDYDGRGNPDAQSGSWALWIPRVVLYPVYAVHEYVIRRPLGALVTKAEREHWADTVESLFTFGPKNNSVVVPTALFDFGLLPSVGIYYASKDIVADGNDLRIHAATWGKPWIHATIADRYTLDSSKAKIEGRFEFRRAEDNLYVGLGPDAHSSAQSRFGLEKVEGSLGYVAQLPGPESRVSVLGGVHRLTPVGGTCCGDPTVVDRIAMGQLMAPPGFEQTYTSAFGELDVLVDSREARPAPGSGAFAHAWIEPNADLDRNRSWMRYGGVLGGAVDLTGKQRILKMQLALELFDRIGGTDVLPFTEYPVNESTFMPGFVTGWLRGQSLAAAQIGYTWPVWIGFDGQTRFTLGNAYGDHLAGLGPAKTRWSWDIGLTTNTRRDQGFELLFGLGSETFEQGGDITSVRLSFGSRQGF